MNKKLNEGTKEELANFGDIVDPIVEYIKDTWEGDFKPKGYKEFIDNYQDYEGMNTVNIDNYKGFLDGTATSYSFPVATSLPHIAYDDLEQGRDPLQMLISSCISYGMNIQNRRNALKDIDLNDIINIVISGEYNHLFTKDFKNIVSKVYTKSAERENELDK